LWLVDGAGANAERLWQESVWDVTKIQDHAMVLTRGDTPDTGVILTVSKSAEKWGIRRRIEVPGLAVGIFVRDDSLLVVTQKGLFRIGKTVTTIMRFSLEPMLPTSIALASSGDVYVGMRHFTMRLRERSGHWSREWLAPRDCAHFRKRSRRPCDCIPAG
jgi:hypothetical protein